MVVADPRAPGAQYVHDFPTCCLLNPSLAQKIHRILQQDESVPQEVKTETNKNVHMDVLASLVTTAEACKQPKCPSADG